MAAPVVSKSVLNLLLLAIALVTSIGHHVPNLKSEGLLLAGPSHLPVLQAQQTPHVQNQICLLFWLPSSALFQILKLEILVPPSIIILLPLPHHSYHLCSVTLCQALVKCFYTRKPKLIVSCNKKKFLKHFFGQKKLQSRRHRWGSNLNCVLHRKRGGFLFQQKFPPKFLVRSLLCKWSI